MILAGQWFKGSELATAMSAFGVFWGLGAFAGPLVGGLAMDAWDPYGLPLVLSIVSVGVLVMSLRVEPISLNARLSHDLPFICSIGICVDEKPHST